MEAVVSGLATRLGPMWGRARALAHETWKYFLVSVVALAVDYGALVALTELGHTHYLVSAGVGFSGGLIVNYLLSVRFVFSERRWADRRRQVIGFLAIGRAGLVLYRALM